VPGSGNCPALTASGLLTLVVVAVLSPGVLLLTALSPEIAAARRVRVRAVGCRLPGGARRGGGAGRGRHRRGAVHRAADRAGRDVAAGHQAPGAGDGGRGLVRTAATWPGVLLAYDSYYWTSGGRAWPVSFFVVAVAVLGYLLTYARLLRRGQAARAPGNQEAP